MPGSSGGAQPGPCRHRLADPARDHPHPLASGKPEPGDVLGRNIQTEPLAMPAVEDAMPVRQAWRAATLGDKSAVSRSGRSVVAKLVMVATAPSRVDIYSRIWL